MDIEKEFYISPEAKGVVRGGFFDEMGGILCGVNAQWICNALNEKGLNEQPSRPILKRNA